VNSVIPGQPAELAGLRPGDIIIGFDGVAVTDVRDLQRKVGRTSIGKMSLVKVIRKGKEEVLPIRVGEFADNAGPAPALPNKNLGLTVETLDQGKAKEFKLKEERGLVVTEVAKDGPAARAGLRPGDLIKELNQQPVSTMQGYHRVLGESVKRGIDLFLIKRGDAVLYIAIRSKG